MGFTTLCASNFEVHISNIRGVNIFSHSWTYPRATNSNYIVCVDVYVWPFGVQGPSKIGKNCDVGKLHEWSLLLGATSLFGQNEDPKCDHVRVFTKKNLSWLHNRCGDKKDGYKNIFDNFFLFHSLFCC